MRSSAAAAVFAFCSFAAFAGEIWYEAPAGVPGAVLVTSIETGETFFECVGYADLEAKRKMTPDTVSISLNASTAEEYVALCRPKFGATVYPALLKFAEEVKGFVKDVVLTVVGTEDLTSEKEAACRRVAAEHGVSLRVRRFERKG